MPRPTFLLVFVCFVLGPTASRAADDSAAIDRYVYSSLRFVMNHGVDLYNTGDSDRCYQHFRQTLEQLVPILPHRPDVQATIKAALGDVETNAEWRLKAAARGALPQPELAPADRQKAFALRAVLNDVRTALAPGKKPPTELIPSLPKVIDDKASAK